MTPRLRKATKKLTLQKRLVKEFPDYHPVIEMARMANDRRNPREVRFAAHREVARYVSPQLKAVEHSTGQGDMEITVKVIPHES